MEDSDRALTETRAFRTSRDALDTPMKRFVLSRSWWFVFSHWTITWSELLDWRDSVATWNSTRAGSEFSAICESNVPLAASWRSGDGVILLVLEETNFRTFLYRQTRLASAAAVVLVRAGRRSQVASGTGGLELGSLCPRGLDIWGLPDEIAGPWSCCLFWVLRETMNASWSSSSCTSILQYVNDVNGDTGFRYLKNLT
jgi:hypothetical protein